MTPVARAKRHSNPPMSAGPHSQAYGELVDEAETFLSHVRCSDKVLEPLSRRRTIRPSPPAAYVVGLRRSE